MSEQQSPMSPTPAPQTSMQPQTSGDRIPKNPFASLLTDNGGPIFPPADEKFNWGAFFLSFIHAAAHGQYKIAGVILVANIVMNTLSNAVPILLLLTFPISLVISYLYAKIGYRAACLGKAYASAEELYQRERKYAIIGAIIFGLLILLCVFMVIVVLSSILANN